MAKNSTDRGVKMPTIEVSHKDLCNLIGKKLTVRELECLLDYAKGEIEVVEGDLLRIEIKDTNRPDLWSAEGIAREIRGRLIKGGLPNYKVGKSKIVVRVDDKVAKVRPLTVCAVATNLKLNEAALSQLIQLQEKISVNFGRDRREVAIGVYDLNRIKPPIEYTTIEPDGIKFVPLDFTEELTPKEILKLHPKGKEFGYLLKDCKEYPMFIDKVGNVLSIPPIINSAYTGKVTEKTNSVFIECSGFNFKFLIPALNIIVTALADRGAKIQTVTVVYPDKRIVTPDLSPKKASVDIGYANKISGLSLTANQMCKLLRQARYDTKVKNGRIFLCYPAYRQDIMHQRDIVEDIIISYGYNRIEAVAPKLVTIGRMDRKEWFTEKVAELAIGLGLQEILSYTLTNKENIFKRMNLEPSPTAEIENPISSNWCIFRTWLLPSLMEFLSHNKHVEYPQKIFEVGDVVVVDKKKETRTKDVRKFACAIAATTACYDDISSVLDAVLRNLGVNYKLKAMKHNSFIRGRVAEVFMKKNKKIESIGFVGELSPIVLTNWGLEMPVAALEIDLDSILASL